MSVDWFLKLKEIDSLTKMRINYLKSKSEQEDRVSKLNERRQETLMQTAKLKQDGFALNHELAALETKLKTASEQKQRLMDMGGDEKKIHHYELEINQAEEQGLELLSRLEEIEIQAQDHKTFLAGLEKTMKEIEEDVLPEVAKLNNEVMNIDLRLKLLLEELPSDFRVTLQKISAKNLAHGPFTRIDQGSCYFCRYKISRLDESEIDMQKNLKTCPQCSRIFLPYGA